MFSGASSHKPAVDDYLEKASEGRAAVAEAFRQAFGFAAESPEAANLSPTQITAWLEGSFAQGFSDENWGSAWTNVSGAATKARIGDNDSVSLPSVSFDPGFRKVVMASVLMLEFSESALSDDTLNTVVQYSLSSAQKGMDALTSHRALGGDLVKRIEDANEAALRQKDIYSANSSDLVNVDDLELAVRIETLRSRLEASYMATARLNQLSLVKYI